MTARYFVDSNVLIYARDVVEAVKQQRANHWLNFLWDTGTGRLSYQVIVEAYSVLTARHLSPNEKARVYLADFLAWSPLSLEWAIIREAWRIQDRYGFNWWDCLIVAAAQAADCDYLLTEDLQHGQDLDGLMVVDPFATAPGVA